MDIGVRFSVQVLVLYRMSGIDYKRFPLPFYEAQECSCHRWIELRVGTLPHLCDNVCHSHPGVIRPIGGHRLHRVADVEDTCFQGDRLSGEAVRIPTPIPTLMVGTHKRCEMT